MRNDDVILWHECVRLRHSEQRQNIKVGGKWRRFAFLLAKRRQTCCNGSSRCLCPVIRMKKVIEESHCKRKRRRIDDDFFARGNRIAHQDSGAIFYVEEHPMEKNVEPMDVSNDENNTISVDQSSICYPCCVPGCTATFSTMLESEAHFDEQHVHQCGECHVVFSCSHLLELHLQEVHDSYFAASVERNQASFKCLVESCGESFASTDERLEHLQSQHQYPRWFRFPISKEDHDVLKKKQKWMTNHSKHSLPPQQAKMKDVNQDKKKKRREQQKKKRATIPCRYFSSPEGCWRGDSCMFLHEKSDVDMSNLVQDMERKAQVSVPDKISFGRRRRKGPY